MSIPHGLATILVTTALAAQCIPSPGSPIAIGQDTISGPLPIGFAFPIFGTTYTDIHVSDHGICYLSNGGTPAPPAATPLVYTPQSPSLVAHGPVICPFWSDTIPGAAGAFFIDAGATVCTVTWVDVQSFGIATPLMTFQLELHSDGSIRFVYGVDVTNNSTYAAPGDNGVVGVSPGSPAVLPAVLDLSASPTSVDDTVFEHFLTANAFDMQGDSLLLTPTNPGWTVAYTPDGSGCAWVEPYGVSCEALTLTSTPPVLGSSWVLTTSGLNVVSQVGFTFFAFGRANPSMPLSAFGLTAPGCENHLPPAMVVTRLVGVNVGGTMAVTVSMPTFAPWLIGESFTNQTYAFTNQNVSGVVSSNAVHCTMGN